MHLPIDIAACLRLAFSVKVAVVISKPFGVGSVGGGGGRSRST